MVSLYQFELLVYSLRFVYPNNTDLNNTHNHRNSFAHATICIANFDLSIEQRLCDKPLAFIRAYLMVILYLYIVKVI
jgi:hypothetical protein